MLEETINSILSKISHKHQMTEGRMYNIKKKSFKGEKKVNKISALKKILKKLNNNSKMALHLDSHHKKMIKQKKNLV